MHIEQIKQRVVGIQSDLDYYDLVYQQKCKYETTLWGVREQKKQEDNQEMLSVLERTDAELNKKLQRTENLLELTKMKILKSLGKA